jgi:D-arabinose 1-dehydrogenase-like Zn-dependent alcohol dehydrogenase
MCQNGAVNGVTQNGGYAEYVGGVSLIVCKAPNR